MKKEIKEIPLDFLFLSEEEMIKNSAGFLNLMQKRRTVRKFSNKPIPEEVITNAIKTAGTAPNGANLQPWHFVLVKSPRVKREIRLAAEKEESEFYNGKAPDEWLNALSHLGTNEEKPFLETAPYLIVVFEERFRVDANSNNLKNYYTKESVGIATGFLITALHNAGLATLTHTPAPMAFLNKILNRPHNEKPYLILVVGYPANNVKVPDITKKELNDILTII